MAKYSVLTDNEKEEAAAEAMLRAAARKGFNQGIVVGALIAAATSVLCTVAEHYIEMAAKDKEKEVYGEYDEEFPF
ncbi:MAG: hypothetical protein J1F60_03010 [Oscillospiraceae bacterium]|nr:hypothetical protein [Oscillospiraceae bacterium]